MGGNLGGRYEDEVTDHQGRDKGSREMDEDRRTVPAGAPSAVTPRTVWYLVFMPPVPVKLGTACASFYRQLRRGPAEVPRHGRRRRASRGAEC